jgi:hypothetical protein
MVSRDVFLAQKIANLALHMREAHGGDALADTLCAMPLPMARMMIAKYLLPHRELVEAGDVDRMLELLADSPRFLPLAVKARADEKVLAYLRLFCATVGPPTAV